MFSEPERLALAGFLAGYSGLTGEAYALDLRHFAAWCHDRGLRHYESHAAGLGFPAEHALVSLLALNVYRSNTRLSG